MGRVVLANSRTPGISWPATVLPTFRLARSYLSGGRPSRRMRWACTSTPVQAAWTTVIPADRANAWASISTSSGRYRPATTPGTMPEYTAMGVSTTRVTRAASGSIRCMRSTCTWACPPPTNTSSGTLTGRS